MKNCIYYQAYVEKRQCWFFVATMRSFEHLCFDRTYDKGLSIFEFFVPEQHEEFFNELMNYYKAEGVITQVNALPHRLILDPSAEV